MSRFELDEALLMTDEQLHDRGKAALVRANSRFERAMEENRDLSSREFGLTKQDRDEIAVVRDAMETHAATRSSQQHETRSQQIQAAIDTRAAQSRLSPLCASAENLDLLERARQEMRSVSVIETRSTLTTTLMGTATSTRAMVWRHRTRCGGRAGYPRASRRWGRRRRCPRSRCRPRSPW